MVYKYIRQGRSQRGQTAPSVGQTKLGRKFEKKLAQKTGKIRKMGTKMGKKRDTLIGKLAPAGG